MIPMPAHVQICLAEDFSFLILVKFPSCRSKDKYIRSHPMEVRINHIHNHLINCADVLKFRRPTEETKGIILDYFSRGHSPSSALRSHKFDLQIQYGPDFYKKHADGAFCPDLYWCYYQYYKAFKMNYGPNYGEGLIQKLREAISNYNEKEGSECAKLWFDEEEGETVIALCTPLMKRVHGLRASGEMIFFDFSGNMDRFDTRIGFLMTHSVAGGLPIGIIMCSSETQALTTKGLELLKEQGLLKLSVEEVTWAL